MSEFANVSVKLEANIYFDGAVTSRGITLADGSVKTLGVMLPGEYEFGTEVAELMEISSGHWICCCPAALNGTPLPTVCSLMSLLQPSLKSGFTR
jgi:hypothetical protein